jgi:hypothetical protein
MYLLGWPESTNSTPSGLIILQEVMGTKKLQNITTLLKIKLEEELTMDC